jgi:hypothetical protein
MTRLLAALAALALLAPAGAHALQYSPPAPLPNSPPADGGLPGGEPSFVFDPSADGHAYIVAPGGDGAVGVAFWSSTDAAKTFGPGRAVGSVGGGGDSEVEVGKDHTVYVADLEVAANAICRSHDFGKTFEDNCETGLASNQAGPESDREWLTASPTDANVLYLTYHDFAGQVPIIEKSTDGGSSWAPCGSIFDPAGPAFSTFSTGGTDIGKPAIGADNTIYVPITEPSSPLGGSYDNFYVAVGDKGCTQTFRSAKVYSAPGASLANIFSFVSLDGGGNVWAISSGKLGEDKPFTVNVFLSRDQGHTWSKPIVVNPPTQKAALFGTIAGGRAPGQAVIGWYGTDTSADPNDEKNEWRYYGATTDDFGEHWNVATITDSPFHYGAICTVGVLCTSGRELLDFSSVGVDPATGCTVQVFPGDPYNTPSAEKKDTAAYVARQTAGACLAGDQSTPAAGPGCRDRQAPTSTFRGRARAGRKGVSLRGRSSDRGCGLRGAGKVARVKVAVGRAVGRRCRYVRANGSFGPVVSCLRTTYLPARGTTAWNFTFRHRLPPGRYVAWVRGIDAAGNVERKARKRNLTRFRVR